MKKIISCSLTLSIVLGTVASVNATELVNYVGSVQEDIRYGFFFAILKNTIFFYSVHFCMF